jgi:hypothetical protein
MRNTVAKKLRKIVGDINNPITRRVYRRLKKQYDLVPQDSKVVFVQMTKETLNGEK